MLFNSLDNCINLLLISPLIRKNSFHGMNNIIILFDIISIFSKLSLINLWKESIRFEVSFKFKVLFSIKFSFFALSLSPNLTTSFANLFLFDLKLSFKHLIKSSRIALTSSSILKLIKYNMSLF